MGHKLLLADDSVTIQRVIELTFAEEDVQVLAVSDGKHAIDRIQSDRPDIVLADVGMPERDGYEVAAFVKSQPHLAHIPVLLLTGAFEPIDETRARAVGCDGVLVKPFEPQMVINRVKDLLAGRKAGGHSDSTTPQAQPAAPERDPFAAPPPNAKPADSLEDYFDRLDAAFATLGGEPAAPASSGAGPSRVAASPAPAAVAPTRPATVEDFASWDPDLAGDAHRPAASMTAAAVHAPGPLSVSPAPQPGVAPIPLSPAAAVAPAEPPTPPALDPPAAEIVPGPLASSPSTPHPPVQQISLAEAFAALLAAEHGQAIAPARPRAAATPAATPSPEIVEDIVRQVLDRLQDEAMRQTVIEVAERLVRDEIDRIKRSNA